MTVNEIMYNVENIVPHNTKEAKTKMLLPTYRFVTSANFILGGIAVVLLLATVLLQNAYAYTQDEIDRNGVKNISIQTLNNNSTVVTFDYCYNKYSKDIIGALVTSDRDAVPLPLDSSKLKYRECAEYGTKVLTKSSSINLTLFEQDKVESLIDSFENKVHDLKNDLSQVYQQINSYTNLEDYKKAEILAQKARMLEQQIKSAQSGLKTLIAMNDS